MKRPGLSLLVVLTALSVAAAASGQAPAPDEFRGSTGTWLIAVRQHTPGLDDHALRSVMTLAPRTFAQVRLSLEARRRRENLASFNALVYRGALMHMDAAMVAANEVTAQPVRVPHGSSSRPTAVLSTDGGYDGLESMGLHWDYGRQLLDLTLPHPSGDAVVRRWYLAAAAFMANSSLLADQTAHLTKAWKLLAADPDTLFVSGCYYEVMASPRVRAVIDSTVLPHGIRIPVPSAAASWRLAEEFFRGAVEGRPAFAAARIRRGRALDMLGRHEDAVQELRAAAPYTTDPALQYYAALFEGAAHEARGDVAMARESYERAAARFPRAQSPLLALSRLVREREDRDGARAAAERVFAHEAQSEMDDPWWTYHLWLVRDADEQLAALRRAVASQPDAGR